MTARLNSGYRSRLFRLQRQDGNVDSYHASSLVAFFLAAALCSGVVLALATQTLPRMDDFCRASAAPLTAFPSKANVGVVDYGMWSYYNWSGRWGGIALETFLLSSTPQPESYPWLLLLVIAAECFLVYVAIKQFFPDARLALCLTALLALIYWANLPGPKGGMFWITGNIENLLSVTLALLLFALLLSPYAFEAKSTKLWRTIVACLLGLVIPALHELVGGLLVLILSATTITLFLLKVRNLWMWVVVWAAAVIGFLVVFLAPGNAIRAASYANRANFRTTFKLSLDAVLLNLVPWCLDFKHWLLAVLLWLDPRVASLRRQLPGLNSLRSIGTFCCIWLSLLMTAIVAAIWETGAPVVPRTMNILYGVFLMGWTVVAFLLTRPVLSLSIYRTQRVAFRSIILVVLSALIATSSNNLLGLSDILHGRARSWKTELNRRFDLLKSAKRESDVQVEPLSVHPYSYIAWEEVTEDPSYWSNQCISQYFGVTSVRVSSPLSSPPSE